MPMRKMSTSTPEVLAQLATFRLLLFAGGLEVLFGDGGRIHHDFRNILPGEVAFQKDNHEYGVDDGHSASFREGKSGLAV